jgi:hypothetical protein
VNQPLSVEMAFSQVALWKHQLAAFAFQLEFKSVLGNPTAEPLSKSPHLQGHGPGHPRFCFCQEQGALPAACHLCPLLWKT